MQTHTVYSYNSRNLVKGTSNNQWILCTSLDSKYYGA
jgi:hypothetical protein